MPTLACLGGLSSGVSWSPGLCGLSWGVVGCWCGPGWAAGGAAGGGAASGPATPAPAPAAPASSATNMAVDGMSYKELQQEVADDEVHE